MKRFELAACLPVFVSAHAVGIEVVLVGGQAVNFYAERFLSECPTIAAFAPFLSKDADLIGTVDDGMRLAKALNVPWHQNASKGGMRGLSLGYLALPDQDDAKVEILGRVLGADADTVRANAHQVQLSGGERLKVINPFLLYMVKGINVVRILQSEPGRERQDARQFAVMGLVTRTILRQLCRAQSPESIRPLIKTCGRLVEYWLSPDGSALVAGGAIHPAKMWPLDALGSHPDASIRHLSERRWPVFARQLAKAVAQVPRQTVEKVQADFKEAGRILQMASEAEATTSPYIPAYTTQSPPKTLTILTPEPSARRVGSSMNLSLRQLDALEHIADHCRKAAQLVSQLQTLAELSADWKTGYALVRCVEIIGEAATHLGPPFHAEHPEIPWRLVMGMGNQLVHGYDDVDDAKFWQTASEILPDLSRQIVRIQEALLPTYLRQSEPPPENPEPGHRL